MKSVSPMSTMKSTIDWVSSAWVTIFGTPLPCPATVGPYAVWPSCSRRSITGCHREPSWQPPCTSTKVYEFSVTDCGSSTLTTVSFTIRYAPLRLPQLERGNRSVLFNSVTRVTERLAADWVGGAASKSASQRSVDERFCYCPGCVDGRRSCVQPRRNRGAVKQHDELLREFLGVSYLRRKGQIEKHIVDPVAVFGDDFLNDFARQCFGAGGHQRAPAKAGFGERQPLDLEHAHQAVSGCGVPGEVARERILQPGVAGPQVGADKFVGTAERLAQCLSGDAGH